MRLFLKLLVGLGLAVGLLLGLAHMHMRALKRASMHGAMNTLQKVYAEYQRTGSLAPSQPHAVVSVFTNTIKVNGMNLPCALSLDWFFFRRDGFLAITTNNTILWLGNNKEPRVIDRSYSPPLFGDGV
jgi:hypothetical protein